MLIYLKSALAENSDVETAVRSGALLRVCPKAITVAVILAGLFPILIGTGTGSEVMSRIAATLAGCNKLPEAAKPSENSSAAASNMSDMAMPAELKHGQGVGTVTAIDRAKGTITLDHGDIAELSWRAMQMGLSAKPEVLAGIKVGDRVDFEIDWEGMAGTISSLMRAEP
jgi:Cu(I)/Ag(I) efflux system periplasmic protein CusF